MISACRPALRCLGVSRANTISDRTSGFRLIRHHMSSTKHDSLATKELSVYIHWPYCKSICPYCDFNRYLMPSGAPKGTDGPSTDSVHEEVHRTMREALLSELQHNLEAYSSNLIPNDFSSQLHSSTPVRRPIIKSIFFGGGTPSLAKPETFKDLIDLVRHFNPPNTPLEVTMEANPTSIETSKLHQFHQAGVNRLSMGVQSLDDADLKYLGRNHSVADALRCYEVARTIFPKISFDLIYGRSPEQTGNKWRQELRKALNLNPTHLSLYTLTFEPGTPFYRALEAGKLSAPSPDLGAELYDITVEETSKYGLNQYEVSNFAVEGHECLHNLNYWQLGDYIGVGPGAASRVTIDDFTSDTRIFKRAAGMCTKSPNTWKKEVLQRGHSSQYEILSPQNSFLELMLTGIRTHRGVSLTQIAEILNVNATPSNLPDQLSPFLNFHAINTFVAAGQLILDKSFIRPTKEGMMISDAILKSILV